MMKMVCTLDAMLFLASKAELAAAADPTSKSNTDIPTDFEFIPASLPKSDDAPDTFVSTNMGKLDFRYWTSIWSGSRACLCVQIFSKSADHVAPFDLSTEQTRTALTNTAVKDLC